MKETVKKYENTYAKFNYEMLQFTLPMTLILICGDVYFLMVCLDFVSDTCIMIKYAYYATGTSTG